MGSTDGGRGMPARRRQAASASPPAVGCRLQKQSRAAGLPHLLLLVLGVLALLALLGSLGGLGGCQGCQRLGGRRRQRHVVGGSLGCGPCGPAVGCGTAVVIIARPIVACRGVWVVACAAGGLGGRRAVRAAPERRHAGEWAHLGEHLLRRRGVATAPQPCTQSHTGWGRPARCADKQPCAAGQPEQR